MEENSGKKEKKSLPFLAIGIVWLVLGFLIPFGLTYRLASNPYSPGVPTRSEPAERTVSDATEEAKRSGLVGALVAAFILLIWKTDRLIFSRDKDLENNARVKIVICLLAFALWVVWTSSGYIMLRVNDEINDQPPQMPGVP